MIVPGDGNPAPDQPADPAQVTRENRPKWEVLGLIGTGGFAEVYKAYDADSQRYAALKIPLRSKVDDQLYLKKLQREASALKRLASCTQIVQFRGWTTFDSPHGGYPSGEKDKYQLKYQQYRGLELEFLEGKDLYTLNTPSKQFPREVAILVAYQIAQGLAAAHHEAIWHHDLTSRNVMLCKDGLVKLLDFGLARVPELSSVASGERPAGTEGSFAPERSSGGQGDGRSDIYQLALLINWMLATSGVISVDSNPAGPVPNQKNFLKPDDPAGEITPGTQELIASLLTKMLIRNPSEREKPIGAIVTGLHKIILAMEPTGAFVSNWQEYLAAFYESRDSNRNADSVEERYRGFVDSGSLKMSSGDRAGAMANLKASLLFRSRGREAYKQIEELRLQLPDENATVGGPGQLSEEDAMLLKTLNRIGKPKAPVLAVRRTLVGKYVSWDSLPGLGNSEDHIAIERRDGNSAVWIHLGVFVASSENLKDKRKAEGKQSVYRARFIRGDYPDITSDYSTPATLSPVNVGAILFIVGTAVLVTAFISVLLLSERKSGPAQVQQSEPKQSEQASEPKPAEQPTPPPRHVSEPQSPAPIPVPAVKKETQPAIDKAISTSTQQATPHIGTITLEARPSDSKVTLISTDRPAQLLIHVSPRDFGNPIKVPFGNWQIRIVRSGFRTDDHQHFELSTQVGSLDFGTITLQRVVDIKGFARLYIGTQYFIKVDTEPEQSVTTFQWSESLSVGEHHIVVRVNGAKKEYPVTINPGEVINLKYP